MNDTAGGNGEKPGGTASWVERATLRLKEFYAGRLRITEPLKEKLALLFKDDARFYTALVVLVFAVSAFILVPSTQLSSDNLVEGDIATRNIYAPTDVVVVDPFATAKKRTIASEATRDVYDMDLGAARALNEKIRRAFAQMQDGYQKNQPKAYEYVLREFDERGMMEFGETGEATTRQRTKAHDALRAYENTAAFANQEKQFGETLEITPAKETTEVLRANHYRVQIAEWLSDTVMDALQSGMAVDKRQLPETSKKGMTVVGSETGERIGSLDFQDVLDAREVPAFIRARVGEVMITQPLSLQKAVTGLAERMVRPNLVFDRARTLDVKRAAREAVPEVAYKFKKGELVVREGEIITPEQAAKMEAMRSGLKFGARAQAGGGAVVFIILALIASGLYLRAYMPEFLEARANVVLLATIFAAQAEFFRLFLSGAEVFASHNSGVSLNAYLYAAPYALAPLLAAIFFTREVAVLASILSAFTAGVLFKSSHVFAMFAFSGGIVAVFHVGRIMRRGDIWRAGLRLTWVNIAVIAMLQMLDGRLFTRDSMAEFLFCVLGGLITVALVLTLTPVVEAVFPVVSDVKLLELQDLNHPLLAKMALVAPGTYHHSIIVGNLAEDAAEAIGANPLLARVGAYFHDIGKIHKPEYFIENQRDGVNRHDAINPNMSALILTSHVSRGLEMAKEYKLIPQVAGMIEEHHGTSLMQFFYHRAKELEKDGTVNEQNFRYPGRKPRSRESAVVSLADSVEAASRALKNPASSRLRQVVSKIINDKFVSGELDDSHLTLRDLNKIGESFVRILHGIFHYRVEYPGDKNEDDNTDNLKVVGPGAEHRKDKEKTPVNLKRIG